MIRSRTRAAAAATLAVLAVGVLTPTAASAATTIPTVAGVLGVDVGELVSDVIKGFLDLLVPDFIGNWVSRIVTWLVAVPDVTNPAQYGHLNTFRRDLHIVAFGLLAVTFVTATLQLMVAGHAGSGFASIDAFKRAVIACVALAAYPTAFSYGAQFANKFTAATVGHPLVADGLDTALGGALAITAVSAGFSLGMAAAAVAFALALIAKLFIVKVALTAVLAVLLVAGPLVWALYPLEQTRWVATIWLAGVIACLAVPIAWALIFAVAGLLSSDSLIWGDPTGNGDGLSKALEATVKPFVAIACFWLCTKAPQFLVAVARSAGLNLSGIVPTSGGGGTSSASAAAGSGRSASRSPSSGSVLERAAQLNSDRFAALRHRAARPTVAGARAIATSSRSRLSSPLAAGAASVAVGAADGTRKAAFLDRTVDGTRKLAAAAALPQKANDWWRALPAEGRALSAAKTHAERGTRSVAARVRPNTSGQPGSFQTASPAAVASPATSAAGGTSNHPRPPAKPANTFKAARRVTAAPGNDAASIAARRAPQAPSHTRIAPVPARPFTATQGAGDSSTRARPAPPRPVVPTTAPVAPAAVANRPGTPRPASTLPIHSAAPAPAPAAASRPPIFKPIVAVKPPAATPTTPPEAAPTPPNSPPPAAPINRQPRR